MSSNSISAAIPGSSAGGWRVWILGGVAAVIALLFVNTSFAPAAAAALLVVCLSAAENESFLLAVIFLIPVGWLAKINFPLGGSDARVDLATGARILVALGFFAGRMWRGQVHVKHILGPALARLSLLFGGVALASVILAPSGILYGSLKAVIRLISYIAFFEFILAWVDSEERIKTVTLTILWSTVMVCGFGFFQEILGDYTSFWLYLNPPEDWLLPMDHRAPSFLNYSNSLAGYLNLILPFALACFAFGEKKWKALGGFVVALGFVTLLCTQSLGGLASFVAVIFLGILLLIKTWKRRILLLTAIFGLAAGFYVFYELLNPAHEGASFGYDQVTRLLLWGVAWNMFAHAPILGIGWGNFVELYGPYLKDFSWIPEGILGTHNTYLQFLSETGILGFGVFSLLLYRAIRQAIGQFRSPVNVLQKTLAFGVLGAVLAVCVHGLVDFLFQVSPQFGTLFWTLLALFVVSGQVLPHSAVDCKLPANLR